MGKGSKRHRSANNRRKQLAKMVSIPSEGPMSPIASNSPLNELGAPGPTVDALGRVNGKAYPDQPNIIEADFLRKSAVAKVKAALGTKVVTPRRVTLLRDHTLDYPALCMSIFVQPDPAVRDDEAHFARMFARAGCRRAPSVLEADLVVFAGGSDVDPVLYNEKKHKSVYSDYRRDQEDMNLYLLCLENGIPMFGVCRGAQFLHVMQGGKLYQHVDNHTGAHSMWDIQNGRHIEKISSVHHQMVIENVKGGMKIIGTSAKSQERWANDLQCFVGVHADIEAFFYRDACVFGVQGHPEYDGYNYFTKWCLDMLNELIYDNPDTTTVSGNIRIKADLMAERQMLAKLPTFEQPIHQNLLGE